MRSRSLQPWFDARKRFKLSHAQIQMARELGLNPKKFGSLANHHQERWKAPLPQFIEDCYVKRFKREQPNPVRTLEELIKADDDKRKEKRKAERASAGEAAQQAPSGTCPPSAEPLPEPRRSSAKSAAKLINPA